MKNYLIFNIKVIKYSTNIARLFETLPMSWHWTLARCSALAFHHLKTNIAKVVYFMALGPGVPVYPARLLFPVSWKGGKSKRLFRICPKSPSQMLFHPHFIALVHRSSGYFKPCASMSRMSIRTDMIVFGDQYGFD